jgi:hypothetical protein
MAKYVTDGAFEALRPLVVAAGDVYELHRDAQPIARLPHASLQQGADPEMSSNIKIERIALQVSTVTPLTVDVIEQG